MIIMKKLSDIKGMPVEAEAYLKQEFRMVHSLYGENIPINKYNMEAIGTFVFIQSIEEISDLSAIGIKGSLQEQDIDIVATMHLPNCIIHDIFLLEHTDKGHRLFILKGMHQELDAFIEKVGEL